MSDETTTTTTDLDPIQLQFPDGRPAGVWKCLKCPMMFSNRSVAARHCICQTCGGPRENGLGNTECAKCLWATWHRRDLERIGRAEKLDAWDGQVWDECDYYDSLDEYVDHLESTFDDPEDWPEFVYLAEAIRLPEINTEHLINNLIDGWEYEGFEPETDIKGLKDLTTSIDAFNAANKSVTAYHRTYKRVVRVPKPRIGTEEPS